MSKILTDNQYYSQIANVIREQNETNNTYTPPQMVSALKDLFYEEVEGVPPISFQGIGEDLLDYRVDGASGGVGDRTSNLFDEIYTDISEGWGVKYKSIFVGEGTFTLSTTCPKQDSGSATNLFFLSGDVTTGANSGTNGVYNNHPVTVTSAYNYVTIGYRAQSYDPRNYTTMLNAGTTALPYEPYGYKVPVVVSGKNLLQNTATSQTIKGVAFTVNSDSSVTCNGTATATTFFTILMTINQGTYIVSGAPVGCNSETPYVTIRLRTPFGGGDVPPFDNNDFGTGVTLISKKNNNNDYFYKIRVPAGYTCDNLTFYPMIRKADIEDDTYEPYHEPTTTNIYLDEPIGENESISLSDTNTNIPTIRGTNVLTVDTTVQPSNVYVKARKESSYEIAMRERYEEAQAQLGVEEDLADSIEALTTYSNEVTGESDTTLSDAVRTLTDGYDKVIALTQAEYDALVTKDANTVYVIVGV